MQVHFFFWITGIILGGGFHANSQEDWIRVFFFLPVMFISIMVHELGHALVSRRYGIRPAIILHGLGGLAVLRGPRLTRSQSILVSLAGPMAGFALGGAVLFLRDIIPLESNVAYFTFRNLLWVNFVWSFFNMLPVLPMDGGQILREALGPGRLAMACKISAFVAVVMAIVSASIGLYIAAIFLAVMAWQNYKNIPLSGGTIHG